MHVYIHPLLFREIGVAKRRVASGIIGVEGHEIIQVTVLWDQISMW